MAHYTEWLWSMIHGTSAKVKNDVEDVSADEYTSRSEVTGMLINELEEMLEIMKRTEKPEADCLATNELSKSYRE